MGHFTISENTFSLKSIYTAKYHISEVYYYLCFVHKEKNFIVDMIKWDINYRSYEAQALDQVFQTVKIMFINTLFSILNFFKKIAHLSSC